MKPETKSSKIRQRYSQQYKTEALALAEKVGVSAAARQLGLHESQLYSWRSKARLAADRSGVEERLLVENARLKRQLAEQSEELAIGKKGRSVLRQGPEVKHVFMQNCSEEFKSTSMSRVLGVSRSGFYRWRLRGEQPTRRQQQRTVLDKLVANTFFARKMRSGSPRLVLDLHDQGHAYDRKTVAASMKRQNLRAKAPNQKWASDITYLWTAEGRLYLAVIIDLFSRQVVGWALAERMTADLVCQALQMALWRRSMPKGVILHSDRGSQYCSAAYQRLVMKHHLVAGMSAKGNCYDNACAESFFHTMKVEAIHSEHFATRKEMRHTVFEYIEVDYNRIRRHSANGRISPMVLEALKAA
ncbi:MAG: IS3 family transposase [Desulfobulbus oligotrophicus]|nr:IS3 family transposase [Desulfobulbus oligotrophicus]